MGMTCCQNRYETEFFSPENTEELALIYRKELALVLKEIKEMEKHPEILQKSSELKFLQIFHR